MSFHHSLTWISLKCCTSFLGLVQLWRRVVGFIYLVELGYISVGILLLGRSSSLTLYLIIESIIKKFCWVFFPKRFSQDNTVVSFLCLVYLSVDLFNVICKRTLTCKNINTSQGGRFIVKWCIMPWVCKYYQWMFMTTSKPPKNMLWYIISIDFNYGENVMLLCNTSNPSKWKNIGKSCAKGFYGSRSPKGSNITCLELKPA